jgi:hypothetical protein
MRRVRILLALALPALIYWALVAEPWKDHRKYKPLEKLPPQEVTPVPSELPKTLTP